MMEEVLDDSQHGSTLPGDVEDVGAIEDAPPSTKPAHHEEDDICGDCIAIPWETFGASEDPSSFRSRHPSVSWRHVLPKGNTWPSNRACRICRFMRSILSEYGHGSTTYVTQLRGVWDAEKPFKVTLLDTNEVEDARHPDCDSVPQAELNTSEDEDEDVLDSDDEATTIWEDSEDGHQTFTKPSFFATSRGVETFRSAMSGYKPTDANFEIIRKWLSDCSHSHQQRCILQDRQYLRNLKVIDCGRRAIVPAPPDCSFVALSYVWGPPSAQPNIASSDLTMDLPRTIEDSMFVTQNLGYVYLWIDRYVSGVCRQAFMEAVQLTPLQCINQNDEREKKEQIAQMADIYAAAAITIIAVAGEDPSHGLPGVRNGSRGLHRHKTVRSVRLFANPSILAQDRYAPYYVHESKWASRAWTYQECYNSPRRLFFTTEQVTLVCNSAVYQETAGIQPYPQSSPIYVNLRGWIKQRDAETVSAAVLEAVPYPLATFMDILSAYSNRQMSYRSDALNAIVGTLDAFSRQSIRHIWGVPIQLPIVSQRTYSGLPKNGSAEAAYALSDDATCHGAKSESQQSDQWTSHPGGSIALLWHHHDPCRRRTGFPSWSPLGWEEGIGWYARRTPSNAGGDFILLLASCHGLKIFPGLEHLMSSNFTTSTCEDGQYLIVEAPTLDLRPTICSDMEKDDDDRSSQLCVAISLDGDLELLLAATWDKDPTTIIFKQPRKGLLLADMNSNTCCSDSPHYTLIIIEQHAEHWERVAIALIRRSYFGTEQYDEDVCDILAAHPPLFRVPSTGIVYSWDLRRIDGETDEMLNFSRVGLETNELWWKRFAKVESITLM